MILQFKRFRFRIMKVDGVLRIVPPYDKHTHAPLVNPGKLDGTFWSESSLYPYFVRASSEDSGKSEHIPA